MILSLNQLKPAQGSKKKKKRVGRGNSSGHGTYATRGLKGQRSRSGGKSGLKRLGFRTVLRSTPKLRGFKSLKTKPTIVNLVTLEEKFSEGAVINPLFLKKNKLIDKINLGVKILGEGKLTKKFIFENCQFSGSAREKILKAGGIIKNS
ncbi:MAG: 50S ribosomal protein L15 [bacterium]